MMQNPSKKPLVIIAGPTAVGKSDMSVKVAELINGEIISADSMQVYRGMDIGTAKIKKEEMNGIRHYLIDALDPKDEFNIVKFQAMAKEAMTEIYSHGKIPILCGGTGFYIQSVLYDIDFNEAEDMNSYRAKLTQIANTNGNEYLHDMLKNTDPAAAQKIHANDLKRVIRALEYYNQTGECISAHNEEQAQNESPYNFKFFVLTDEREIIYDKINRRVDLMIEKGLVEEVKRLKDQGLDDTFVSMKGLGYKEILEYLDGKITLDEAIYKIKRDSRHFAKRQLTWFKRERNIIWLDKSKETKENILSTIVTQTKAMDAEEQA